MSTSTVSATQRLTHFLRRSIAAAGVIVVAMTVSNVANYLFSLIMGRTLGPEGFGELGALLGVLMILSIATQSVQTLVARYSTELHRDGGEALVGQFVDRLSRRATYIGIACFIIWIPLSWPLARMLQIDHVVPVLVTGTALIIAFTLPVMWGAMQGMQEFSRLGLSLVVVAVGRLVIGVALVAIGAGVAGAVGALTIATFIALVLVMPRRRPRDARAGRVGPSGGEMLRYAYPTLAGVLAWTLLTNLDVVFVKSMSDADAAGYYNAAATIGKIALFLPVAVGIVLFSKGAASHVAGRDSRHLIRRTGQGLLALAVLFVILVLVADEQLIRLMFGTTYAPAADLALPIVIAMSCFAIANALLYYYLSTHRMRFTAVLFAAVAVQVVALAVFAGDPLAAARVQLVIGVAIIVVNELFFVPLLLPLRGRFATAGEVEAVAGVPVVGGVPDEPAPAGDGADAPDDDTDATGVSSE